MFKQCVCMSVSRKLLKMGRAINYGHHLAADQNDRPLLVFLPPIFSRSLSFSLSSSVTSASLSWVLSLILLPFYSTAARLMKQDLADLRREQAREKESPVCLCIAGVRWWEHLVYLAVICLGGQERLLSVLGSSAVNDKSCRLRDGSDRLNQCQCKQRVTKAVLNFRL